MSPRNRELGKRKTTTADARRDAAIFQLARRLYETMEHLDPLTNEPMVNWADLTNRQRDFYRLCICSLLERDAVVRVAIGLAPDPP
jgi:hypothetical protein